MSITKLISITGRSSIERSFAKKGSGAEVCARAARGERRARGRGLDRGCARRGARGEAALSMAMGISLGVSVLASMDAVTADDDALLTSRQLLVKLKTRYLSKILGQQRPSTTDRIGSLKEWMQPQGARFYAPVRPRGRQRHSAAGAVRHDS